MMNTKFRTVLFILRGLVGMGKVIGGEEHISLQLYF